MREVKINCDICLKPMTTQKDKLCKFYCEYYYAIEGKNKYDLEICPECASAISLAINQIKIERKDNWLP